MATRTASRTLAALLAATLLFTVTAAWATPGPNPGGARPGGGANPLVPPPVGRGTITASVTVAGHAIGGMSEDQARAVILTYVKPTGFAAITAKAAGVSYTLAGGDVFYTDSDAMLDAAYAASGPLALTPKYGYDTRPVDDFITRIGQATDHVGSNASWVFSAKRYTLIKSQTGKRTDRTTARSLVLAALKKEASNGAAQAAVTIPVAMTPPTVVEKNLPRVILVVLSERYLRLYDPIKGGVLKGYHCAVGQPAWPTPTGLWKIVLKRYMPTWVNPGSSWGTGMPAVIGPGPNNPLGTRALNLNADGIRIHGTENVGSIGTAASHGCMRLVRHDIEELYDLVVVGTPVRIVP